MGVPLGAQGLFVRLGQHQGRAVVNGWAARCELRLALQLQFQRRLVTIVKPSGRSQTIRRFVIAVKAGRLVLLAIPGQAQPFQVAADLVGVFGLGAFWIGVVDAQNERAPGLGGDQPVQHRRPQISDMQIARGRGREAGRGHRLIQL